MFFFNLGLNTPIKKEDVIGIFDLDTSTIQKHTKDFLNAKEKEKKIEYVGKDLPRSFVLCDDKIYITSLSSAVLEKRAYRDNI